VRSRTASPDSSRTDAFSSSVSLSLSLSLSLASFRSLLLPVASLFATLTRVDTCTCLSCMYSCTSPAPSSPLSSRSDQHPDRRENHGCSNGYSTISRDESTSYFPRRSFTRQFNRSLRSLLFCARHNVITQRNARTTTWPSLCTPSVCFLRGDRSPHSSPATMITSSGASHRKGP